jgi:hypothetical protein
MNERSSSRVSEELEWPKHIEAVLEILNEAIGHYQSGPENSLCKLSLRGVWYPGTGKTTNLRRRETFSDAAVNVELPVSAISRLLIRLEKLSIYCSFVEVSEALHLLTPAGIFPIL